MRKIRSPQVDLERNKHYSRPSAGVPRSKSNLDFLDKSHTIKTPGIVWQHSEDRFVFKVSHIEKDNFEGKILTR